MEEAIYTAVTGRKPVSHAGLWLDRARATFMTWSAPLFMKSSPGVRPMGKRLWTG